MKKIIACILVGIGVGGSVLSHQAAAQPYPSKPVKIVVGFAPGGFTDVLARLIGQKLGESLGQRFVIENKPGAGGTIGADIVAKSKPDGYTLLLGHVTANAIAPSLYAKLPYDVFRDFTPITRVASTPFFLAVNPKVPANDVQSFIALAKKDPGALRFASSGHGTAQHLAAEKFMLMTGTSMTHVPYKGSSHAIVDLLSGEVDLNFESPPNTLQHIKAGRLKALGITSANRSPLVPGVPTIAEQGLPGFEMVHWFAVFGPGGLPREITRKLNTEIIAILSSPEVKEQINAQGGDVIASGPDEFAAFLAKEVPAWAKFFKEAKIKPE